MPAHHASATTGSLPSGAPEQQPAQRLDDRRHRLVLADRLQRARHRVQRHERAADVWQEHQHERERARRLRVARDHAETRDADFAFGLGLLLDGVERLVEQRARA
jgi:hypothetical protein